MSAFASAASLVMGQVSCDTKSSEITAIPKLLEMLDIHGCLVTIDAMGTQRDIADQLTGADADYILQVKASQPILREALKDCFADCTDTNALPDGIEYAVTEDAGHGRAEKRECFLMSGTAGWAEHRRNGRLYDSVLSYDPPSAGTGNRRKRVFTISSEAARE